MTKIEAEIVLNMIKDAVRINSVKDLGAALEFIVLCVKEPDEAAGE